MALPQASALISRSSRPVDGVVVVRLVIVAGFGLVARFGIVVGRLDRLTFDLRCQRVVNDIAEALVVVGRDGPRPS